MFSHTFKHTFKILLRERQLVFWSLLFPIILGLLFKLALGNIDSANVFKAIPVSVEEDLMNDPFFSKFMDALEKEEYFKVYKSNNKNLLNDKEVVAHIQDKGQVITKSTGIEETIVESIMDSYLQNEATAMRIMAENPNMNILDVFKVNDYIDDKSNPNMNSLNTYFYTLIGMQAMYGYMWGMEVMYQYEANLSTKAKRNAIAPVNKRTSLASSLLVAWIINMAVLAINMLVCKYIHKIDFGNQLPPLIALVALGAFTGVCFGAFIAVSNKKSVEYKVGLGVSLTMLMSFLAGMMVSQIKVLIQRYAPIVNKLNPVALITDGIYSLYYYDSASRLFTNMAWLALVTVILLGVTMVMTKGKKYDSL